MIYDGVYSDFVVGFTGIDMVSFPVKYRSSLPSGRMLQAFF